MAGGDDTAPACFAVSLGDPAGIGAEVTGKAWAMRQAQGLPRFFAVGDIDALRGSWDGPVVRIEAPAQCAAHFNDALPCLHVASAGPVTPGTPSVDGAHAALQALETAVGLARSAAAAGIVTAPVGKAQLYEVGFTHPGQTEFIAERCGVARENAVMMLAGPGLRVVPITIHIALKDVPAALTTELIVARSLATAKGLHRNFGIAQPRLVMAGLKIGRAHV